MDPAHMVAENSVKCWLGKEQESLPSELDISQAHGIFIYSRDRAIIYQFVSHLLIFKVKVIMRSYCISSFLPSILVH